MPLGIDFSGGTIVILRFAAAGAPKQALRDGARGHPGRARSSSSTAIAGANEMHGAPAAASAAEAGLQPRAGRRRRSSTRVEKANLGKFEVLSTEIVGPVDRRATCSARASTRRSPRCSASLTYIAFRFRFSFAVGAIVATLHDILVTLAVPRVLPLRPVAQRRRGHPDDHRLLGQRHDRHLRPRPRESPHDAARDARPRSSTAASTRRWAGTIITAGTTFLSRARAVPVRRRGARGFAFTMLVGIVTGTYSTVFIAVGHRDHSGPAQAEPRPRRSGGRHRRRREPREEGRARPEGLVTRDVRDRGAARRRAGAHRVPAGLELRAPDPGPRAFFGWDADAFGLAFDVACHVGTLLAVVCVFLAPIVLAHGRRRCRGCSTAPIATRGSRG